MINEKTGIDNFVRDEIKKLVGKDFSEQTSDIADVKLALKGASKTGGTGDGKPDFSFVYENCLFVIEDKKAQSLMVSYKAGEELDLEAIKGGAVENYAVNGAVFYAKNIVEKSTHKQVIAIGATPTVSRGLAMQPYFVDLTDDEKTVQWHRLNSLSSFDDLVNNFDEWYQVEVLGEDSQSVIENERIQNLAADIHEDLRNYGALGDEEKPLVVSAILLALFNDPNLVDKFYSRKSENEQKLDKDGNKITDGKQVYDQVVSYFDSILGDPRNREIRADLAEKFEVVKSRFQFIANQKSINSINSSIKKTPISYYTEKIAQTNLAEKFSRTDTDFDVLGHFYQEFVSYGGKDSANLGIVLTPAHITKLMADLIDVNATDVVLDPTCGSGGFLVAAMNRMLNSGGDYTLTEKEVNQVKREKLYGIELSEKLFVVAVTNMILRGDGKSNLKFGNMFDYTAKDFPEPVTKVLMNPPYSQGTKTNPDLYEINFIKHALEMMDKSPNSKLAVIVPQSTFTSDTRGERLGTKDTIKAEILANNTLEAVITLNKDTFNGTAGVHPVIAIFNTAKGQGNQPAKFFDFRNDGYSIWKHKGQLKDDGSALDKRRRLKYVFKYGYEQEDMGVPRTSFMVQSPIKATDEWLHSYFYFNDAIPKAEDFAKTVQDYLAFKFDQTVHGRGYLFEDKDDSAKK